MVEKKVSSKIYWRFIFPIILLVVLVSSFFFIITISDTFLIYPSAPPHQMTSIKNNHYL